MEILQKFLWEMFSGVLQKILPKVSSDFLHDAPPAIRIVNTQNCTEFSYEFTKILPAKEFMLC